MCVHACIMHTYIPVAISQSCIKIRSNLMQPPNIYMATPRCRCHKIQSRPYPPEIEYPPLKLLKVDIKLRLLMLNHANVKVAHISTTLLRTSVICFADRSFTKVMFSAASCSSSTLLRPAHTSKHPQLTNTYTLLTSNYTSLPPQAAYPAPQIIFCMLLPKSNPFKTKLILISLLEKLTKYGCLYHPQPLIFIHVAYTHTFTVNSLIRNLGVTF